VGKELDHRGIMPDMPRPTGAGDDPLISAGGMVLVAQRVSSESIERAARRRARKSY
jgi:hypothetical protein